jgi:hypothetical protein
MGTLYGRIVKILLGFIADKIGQNYYSIAYWSLKFTMV